MKYSQNDEETHILDYFGEYKGAVLDLGANDGVTLSNSRALILLGWHGVMVDASPAAFVKLQKLYQNAPDIELHNVAIADRDGWVTLHESGQHITANDTALLSSILEDETTKWRTTMDFKPITVPCISIATLLARSKFSRFEFITIDIEGVDLVALQALDLKALGTGMVVVEVNDRETTPYIDHCEKHGLRLIHRTPENLIFAR